MSDPAEKKEALYELIEIPEPFGPVEVVVDRAKVESFGFAVGDAGSWYVGDESPFGAPIGQPLALANDLLFLFYDKYDGHTAKGLHTHERLSFISPVRRGETVTVSGAYVDRFERRGHGYVVLEATAYGEDGRELVKHRGTEIMRAHAGSVVGRRSAGEPSSRVVTGETTDAAPVSRAALGIAPRTPIKSLARVVTQEQMHVFSWGDRGFKNVHTDLDAAAERGLNSTLVQAQQQTSIIAEAMTRFFGAGFMTSGELDLGFISPAYPGEELVVEGAVLGDIETREGPGIEVEIWVRRPDGTKTGIGWASAAISALPSPAPVG